MCVIIQNVFFFIKVAFLFNWIGFFLSFCLTTSAAGRYGAISGFGLSLIKWVLIVRVRTDKWIFTTPSSAIKWLLSGVKAQGYYFLSVTFSDHCRLLTGPILFFFQFSTYFPGYFDGQYWLWWVFLALGKFNKIMSQHYFIQKAFLVIYHKLHVGNDLILYYCSFLHHMCCLCCPGFMLFIRGFVNYSRVRKLADPTYATLPRTRVLFIY